MDNKKLQILKIKDKGDTIFKKKPKLFDIPFKLAIIGKSQISLGKTTIILNLLLRDDKHFYKNDFEGENIYIISNNKIDTKLKTLAKQKDIPSENMMMFDEERIDCLYDILEDDFESGDRSKKLIIFDDVAYSGGLKGKESGVISRIVMNGRHINISSIFTSQKISLLGTNIRSQLTGALIGNVSNRELELIEAEFNILPSKRAFFKMFRDHTKNRDFIVFNLTNGDDIYQDKNFNNIDTSKYYKS